MIQGEQGRLQIVQGMVDGLDVVQNVALSDEQVLPAVVIEVFQAGAPAGTAGAKCTEADFETLIAERAFAIVVVEPIDFPGQLGNDDVGLAVVVVVLKDSPHAGKRFAIGRKRGTGVESALRERAVAAIAIEKVSRWGKFARRAIGLPGSTAGFAVLGVPFHVTGDKKIEMAVVIEVEKTGRDGPAAACDSCFGGNVGESFVAIIVIKDVLPVARNE